MAKYERHGLSKTREFNQWAAIINRCYNENDPNYFRYGGRGIKVYDEWADDFKSFYDYVTGLPDYDDTLTIDRKNNDLGYIPDNLRWATMETQCRNRGINSTNKSGYSGVYYSKYKDKVYIHSQVGGVYLGSFETEEDAAMVRDQYIIDNDLSYKLQILNSTKNN